MAPKCTLSCDLFLVLVKLLRKLGFNINSGLCNIGGKIE